MPFAQDRFFILLNVHFFVKCLKQLRYYEASQQKFWEPNFNDIDCFHFGFRKQVENERRYWIRDLRVVDNNH